MLVLYCSVECWCAFCCGLHTYRVSIQIRRRCWCTRQGRKRPKKTSRFSFFFLLFSLNRKTDPKSWDAVCENRQKRPIKTTFVFRFTALPIWSYIPVSVCDTGLYKRQRCRCWKGHAPPWCEGSYLLLNSERRGREPRTTRGLCRRKTGPDKYHCVPGMFSDKRTIYGWMRPTTEDFPIRHVTSYKRGSTYSLFIKWVRVPIRNLIAYLLIRLHIPLSHIYGIPTHKPTLNSRRCTSHDD